MLLVVLGFVLGFLVLIQCNPTSREKRNAHIYTSIYERRKKIGTSRRDEIENHYTKGILAKFWWEKPIGVMVLISSHGKTRKPTKNLEKPYFYLYFAIFCYVLLCFPKFFPVLPYSSRCEVHHEPPWVPLRTKKRTEGLFQERLRLAWLRRCLGLRTP